MPVAKRVTLVTGASGFLGLFLCKRLQREGEYVRACARHAAEGPWQEFHEVNLGDRESLKPGLFEDVTTVFHLGSVAHANDASEEEVNAVIVDGTRILLEKAGDAGVSRFIYFSSVKAMGEGNPEGMPLMPIDETWPHAPSGLYGTAKYKAESLVAASPIGHKVILRPVMVYGEGQKGNLARMIHAVQKGRFPPVPETFNKRSTIHVDDVIEFAIRAAQFPIANGKRYILASDVPVSTRGLYDSIRQSLGLPRQDWNIPMWVLLTVATFGSMISSITRRQLPLDQDTLKKLTGSAWYSSGLARQELRFQPVHEIQQWLTDNPVS